MAERLPLASGDVDVSVVIVNYNTAHLLVPMRDALRASQGHLRLQLIVIDNASRDDSIEVIRRELPEAQLIANEANVGFGRANNQALPFATGRHVLLLNTDAFVSPDTLAKTVGYLDAHPEVGILGVRLTGSDGELQPCCRRFPTPWNAFVARAGLVRWLPRTRMVDDMSWDHASVRECDWVPGCYYLVRREVIEQVGLFDPRYFLYCEEVDHCRAARSAGWKVVFYPHTTVIHLGGESAKSDAPLTPAGKQISVLQLESELLYFRKHHGVAGLAQAMLLGTLGNVVLAAKCVLKAAPAGLRNCWADSRLRWSLFLRTGFGRRATR